MSHPLFHRHPKEVAERLIASGIWNEDTAWGWLDDWARRAPERPAVIEHAGRSLSYGELCEASRRFANALKEIGIRKGDVVAIQLPSSVEFLIAYFGVTRAGAILATLHMPYREAEMEPLLRFGRASAIICGPSSAKYDGPHMMRRLAAGLPDLQHIIVARGREPGEGWLHMQDMIDGASSAPGAERPAAGDPALMCFTSGTSSAPKAVIHSFETLAADARAYVRTIGKSEKDRTLIAPPFTHIFGLECVDNIVLTGGTIIPLDQFTPERFVTLIDTLQPSIVYGAPAHLAASLRSGAMEGRDLSSIRQVIIGGSICPPHVALEFEQRLPNGKVGILFGMTETLLITQTPFEASHRARHATVGKPVPGIELRIIDPEGNPSAPGEEGELQVRGFSIMAGYVANPEANARAFTDDGWFRTGDLACWDDEGNVCITGRLIDVINRGGVKINPTDLEAAIAGHEAVVDVAVIPIPDEVLGERICAAVTLAPGKTLELPDLCAFLQQLRIAKARWPERLVIFDSLPMTPTKKVIKGALRKLVEQRLAREPARSSL